MYCEASPLIENNLLLNNERCGIYVRSSSCQPEIRYNTIDGNGQKGIYFYYYSPSTVVENNIVTHNLIGIYSGANAQRANNNVWNNATDFDSTAAFPS